MDTRRATEVMAIGLYHRFCEIWIGEQPFLLLTHIGVYFPALYRQIMVYVAGPARVAASLNNESVMDVWVGH